MLVFAQALEKQAREAQEQRMMQRQERALAEAAEAEFWNQTEKAEAALDEAVAAGLPPATPAKGAPARGDFGAVAALRKTWTYEVVDPALIPREFLMVNDKAVKAAIAAGGMAIPGLRIFQKDSMAVR